MRRLIATMRSSNGQPANGRSQQRVAVFIDGSNLYHSLDENCKRFDLDFAAFADKLCNGRDLFRIYYYNVLRDPDRNPQAYQDQQKFLTALYNTRLIVSRGPTGQLKDPRRRGRREGNRRHAGHRPAPARLGTTTWPSRRESTTT